MFRTTTLIAVCVSAVYAQTAATPTFEAASLKRSGPRSVRGWEGGPGSPDPTRYFFGRATLVDFIGIGYDVTSFRISSRVSLDEAAFDLEARLPAGATKEELREMLRNLLAERFHLRSHIESRDFPAYEMVVAKSGLKITESATHAPGATARDSREGFPVIPSGRPGLRSAMSVSGEYQLVRLRAQLESLSAFANFISLPGEPPVVDRTGLTGLYDFTFEYTLDPPGAPPAGAEPPLVENLLVAVQRQLGLQLIPKKLPFDVVVVDSIDRLPTGN